MRNLTSALLNNVLPTTALVSSTLMSLLFSMSVQAADFYRVEVVIVGYFDESSAASEHWAIALEQPLDETMIEDTVGDQEFLLQEADAEVESLNLEPDVTEPDPAAGLIRPASGLDFRSAAQRFNYRQDMQVLWHQAWLEKIQDQDNAIAHEIDISGEKNGLQSQITGTISLYKSRFLHIQPDLKLQQNVQGYTDNPDDPYSSERQWLPIRAAHIDRSRRMRSNEIHYLDHPLLGIVAKVTPIETAEEETAAPSDSDSPAGPSE